MIVQTERLDIIPLTPNQLKLWIEDIPNENGEVEIGYGLGKEFEHNGYMTEAVKAMCEWALKQNCVINVIAETELEGLASQKILERCGFKKDKEGETLWWSL